MKTRLLIVIGILTIIPISVLFIIDNAYALCDPNPDWPEKPCYAFPGANSISSEERWERWAAYYDYKGGEWMEMKRIELLQAIENNSVEKWMSEGEASVNVNVFEYYFYKGVIPNLNGEFAYPDKQIKNDSCPVHYFLNYAWQDCGSIFTWSILGIPLLVIIVAPIGSILAFIIWRIKK